MNNSNEESNLGCANLINSRGCQASSYLYECVDSRGLYFSYRLKDSHRSILCFGESIDNKLRVGKYNVLNVQLSRESFEKNFSTIYFRLKKDIKDDTNSTFVISENTLKEIISKVPELSTEYPKISDLYAKIPSLFKLVASSELSNSNSLTDSIVLDGKKYKKNFLKKIL